MLRHYFVTILRNLGQNKSFSAINISGLGLGMAVALLIGLWMRDELTYDRFHPNHSRLYQVMLTDKINGKLQTWYSVPLTLADKLRTAFPEIKAVAEADWGWAHGLKVDEKRLYQSGLQVHGDFLKMFHFPLVAGNAATALEDPYSIVLSSKTAQSLFGVADPIGKTVRLDNAYDLKVTGVLADIPDNSSLHFNFLAPFSLWENTQNWVKESRQNWSNYSFQIYLELQPDVAEADVLPKIKELIRQNHENGTAEVTLHALDQWRLYEEFENGEEAGGFIRYVKLFGWVGFFVLLIACINFMNLSTARSEKRAKEVGIRKTLGSARSLIIRQFLGEATLLAFTAMVMATVLVQLALPAFNQLTQKELAIPYTSPWFWTISIGFVLLTGLLAGSYPAFFLSGFKPIAVLRPVGLNRQKGGWARKALVVSQFTVSISLIISTVVIWQQIQHAKHRPAGYDPNRLMMVTMSGDMIDNYEPLRNELLATGMVSGLTKASSPVTSVYANMRNVEWPGKSPDDDALFATVGTSLDYFETLNIGLKEGRFFSKDFPADTASIIFNETAIKRMGLQDPLNTTIRWNERDYRIVGVVNDVLMINPYGQSSPTMFLFDPAWNSDLMFRLAPGTDTRKAISTLEPIFSKYNPAYPFDYSFADEAYGQKFLREELVGKVAGLFAGLAIFISCLGLLGLASYLAERRTKEIGIRKVLGASVTQLWGLLSREFVLLVGAACLIAAPLASYFLSGWLEKFDYRIHLSWWMFGLAAIIALGVTLFVVSFQTVKAAMANPIKSLRSE